MPTKADIDNVFAPLMNTIAYCQLHQYAVLKLMNIINSADARRQGMG
jgi:hypothetical protein